MNHVEIIKGGNFCLIVVLLSTEFNFEKRRSHSVRFTAVHCLRDTNSALRVHNSGIVVVVSIVIVVVVATVADC